MSGTTEMEPWLWPELHWRGVVNHVRAGRALKPAAWKDGARCAVAFSFDSDHETRYISYLCLHARANSSAHSGLCRDFRCNVFLHRDEFVRD
jgi:hypothetical protein